MMPCVPARRTAADARDGRVGKPHRRRRPGRRAPRSPAPAVRTSMRSRPPVSRSLPSRAPREVRIERGQPVQPPDGQLRYRHRLERARRHEGQRGRYRHSRPDLGRIRRLATGWACAGTISSRSSRTPRRITCGGTVSLAVASASGTPCRTWKTRPPVTGLASASRTSTSCARRNTCRVRRPVRVCSLHRAASNRPAKWRTGTMPLAPLSVNCDEQPESRHARNSRSEMRADFVRHVCSEVTVDRLALGKLGAALGGGDVLGGRRGSARPRLLPGRRRRAAGRRSARDAPAGRRSGGSGW